MPTSDDKKPKNEPADRFVPATPATPLPPPQPTSLPLKEDVRDPAGFWNGRWARGETGWHQNHPEPLLVSTFSDIDLSPRPTVLVPLCGKSLDLRWLSQRGFNVIGAELSQQACEEFFKEHGIAYTLDQPAPGFCRFSSQSASGPAGRITIWQGDFFELKPAAIGSIDFVYDRAALIALAKPLRERYARQILELGLLGAPGQNASPKPSQIDRGQASAIPRALGISRARIFQIVIERPDDLGPPYHVPRAEIEALYGAHYRVIDHSREATELRGGVAGVEASYWLLPR